MCLNCKESTHFLKLSIFLRKRMSFARFLLAPRAQYTLFEHLGVIHLYGKVLTTACEQKHYFGPFKAEIIPKSMDKDKFFTEPPYN